MPRRTRYEPPVYTFRVRILGGYLCPEDWPATWRDIEIAANQTLADLGQFIPDAFEFYDPHLWSFFLSKRAWDRSSEYTLNPEPAMDPILLPPGLDAFRELLGGLMEPEAPAQDAAAIQIRDVPYPGKTGKKEFLYLFDYGDEWHFGVKLRGTSDAIEPGASYPRVVASEGEAPPQYPDLDDLEDEWAEDDPWGVVDLDSLVGNMLQQFGVSPLRPDPALLGAAWQALVEAENAQVERLREWHEPDHYAPIAQHFADDPHRTGDPLLDRLRALSRPDATWLDIGAGGGRYALPLAMVSRNIIAVDPSEGMLQVLRAGMAEHDIDNIEIHQLRWPEGAGEIEADFSLAAHVGYDIREINPFLDGLERATREMCCVIMMDRAPSHGYVNLWEEVHSEPRIQLPALREMLHLLLARGATPEVQIVQRELRPMDEQELRDNARRRLWLSEGSEKDRRLQQLLDAELARGVRLEDFDFPSRIALITWRVAKAS